MLLLCLIILHVCVSQEELEEPTVPEIMEVVVEAGEEEGTMEVETEVVGEEEVTDTSIKYQTTFPCSFDLLNCFVSLFNLIHLCLKGYGQGGGGYGQGGPMNMGGMGAMMSNPQMMAMRAAMTSMMQGRGG